MQRDAVCRLYKNLPSQYEPRGYIPRLNTIVWHYLEQNPYCETRHFPDRHPTPLVLLRWSRLGRRQLPLIAWTQVSGTQLRDSLTHTRRQACWSSIGGSMDSSVVLGSISRLVDRVPTDPPPQLPPPTLPPLPSILLPTTITTPINVYQPIAVHHCKHHYRTTNNPPSIPTPLLLTNTTYYKHTSTTIHHNHCY